MVIALLSSLGLLVACAGEAPNGETVEQAELAAQIILECGAKVTVSARGAGWAEKKGFHVWSDEPHATREAAAQAANKKNEQKACDHVWNAILVKQEVEAIAAKAAVSSCKLDPLSAIVCGTKCPDKTPACVAYVQKFTTECALSKPATVEVAAVTDSADGKFYVVCTAYASAGATGEATAGCSSKNCPTTTTTTGATTGTSTSTTGSGGSSSSSATSGEASAASSGGDGATGSGGASSGSGDGATGVAGFSTQ